MIRLDLRVKHFIKRLRFVTSYDIDYEYIVFYFDAQMFVRFLSYDDAKAFSDSQIQYRPKVMVGITKRV